MSDYSPARPCRLADVPHWDIETDVAVVGFGAAGSCAAIEARQAGAEVDVFEIAAKGGGSASWSGGEVYVGGSGGTSVQLEAGFTDATDDFERYLLMAGACGRCGAGRALCQAWRGAFRMAQGARRAF